MRVFGFQSLSGFLMRCDDPNFLLHNESIPFQSLSGFLMRCDEILCHRGLRHRSFNPYRVF